MTQADDELRRLAGKGTSPSIIRRAQLYQSLDHSLLMALWGYTPMSVPEEQVKEWEVVKKLVVNPVTKVPMFIAQNEAMAEAILRARDLGYNVEDQVTPVETALLILDALGRSTVAIRKALEENRETREKEKK